MNVIDVATGEVKTSENRARLMVNAIGSCVAVVGYNIKTGRGGAAHVMLPGGFRSSPEKKDTRYARDAIECLLEKLDPTGTEKSYLRVSLIGGANVLENSNGRIGRDNVWAVQEEMRRWGIRPDAEMIGGKVRRQVMFNLENGELSVREGDSPPKSLKIYRRI